jgi:drug/metabolite transporter (DMT)-like permease
MQLWFIYAISAAVLWGFQYSSYGAKLSDIPATVYSFYYYLGVTIINTIIVLYAHPVSAMTLPRSQWGWMAANILVGAFASLFIAKSIQHESAAHSSMIEIAYPLFVLLFSFLLFKEQLPTARQLIGGGFVFFGILLILK